MSYIYTDATEQEVARLQCDMDKSCMSEVTHIDCSGFVYCTDHGVARREWKCCRKLRPHELNRLKRGEPLTRY